MTADPPAEPSPRALGESLAALAAQLADLRGQVRAINERLDQAAWSLELVREEDKASSDKIGNRVRRVLDLVRAAFASGKNRPLVLVVTNEGPCWA